MPKGTKDKKILINNIMIRPIRRSQQDVQKWRTALQAAESQNPRRTQLYDLYHDLILDATLSSLVDKRILNVTKTDLRYYNAKGEEVEAMTDLIGMNQFHELRKQLVLQKIWGITVCELSRKGEDFSVFNIPRKHIRPDIGKIVWEQNGEEGVEYREPPFDKYIVEAGTKNDLGLLLKAAPYVIYKRGGFGDWSKYAEMFGMPFREAKYDGFNDEVRKQLEQAMEYYGSAPFAILPKEADFELHQTSNTQGGGELYNELRIACNQELSVLILGQTETTMSSKSSGYAQGKVHARTEDDINESDRKDELFIMNERVAPVLKNLGYPIIDGGYFDHQLSEEEIPKKDQAEILVKLKKGLNLPVDDDYIYERFGIPKPKNYDQVKTDGRPSPGDGDDRPSPDDNDDPDKKEKRKLAFKDKVLLKLSDFFD